MRIGLDEFHKKLIHPENVSGLKRMTEKKEKFAFFKNLGFIILDQGAVQVESEEDLAPPFVLDDNTFWAYYQITDYSQSPKIDKDLSDITKPIRLIIHDADDTYFEKYFSDEESAKSFLDVLAKEPRDFFWFEKNMDIY